MIAGPNRLDNEVYFRDSVQLNSVDLAKYLSLIKSTLAYCYRKYRIV